MRRALETLYDEGAVSLRRTEDSETGWVSFRWRLEPERTLERFERNRRSLLRETRERLEHERETVFFACENRCDRVEFEEAADLGFECPGCGGGLHRFDNAEVIRGLERRVEELERNLEKGPSNGG